MSANPSTSKTTLVAQCQAIIAAITTFTVTEYLLGGKDLQKADLIAAFQAYLDAVILTASTKKSYQNAVIAETVQTASARSLRALLKAFLQSRFGKNSPELTPFSFAPAKTTTKTVEVKAVAVAKSARTKKALNTMGPKERKAAIKKIAATPMTETAPTPSASPTIDPIAADRPATAEGKTAQALTRIGNG